jgi:hypothetical protein
LGDSPGARGSCIGSAERSSRGFDRPPLARAVIFACRAGSPAKSGRASEWPLPLANGAPAGAHCSVRARGRSTPGRSAPAKRKQHSRQCSVEAESGLWTARSLTHNGGWYFCSACVYGTDRQTFESSLHLRDDTVFSSPAPLWCRLYERPSHAFIREWASGAGGTGFEWHHPAPLSQHPARILRRW